MIGLKFRKIVRAPAWTWRTDSETAMQKTAPDAAPNPAPAEQRRLPRKNALLGGVIADLNTQQAWDCTIHDINARGAAISVGGRLPVGVELYLLDTANREVHLARVMWSNYERSGLLFAQSHAMGLGLPPRMRFLWGLLLDAKLRQAERAVASGASSETALGSVGLTREHVHQMARFASADKRFRKLLARVEQLLQDADNDKDE